VPALQVSFTGGQPFLFADLEALVDRQPTDTPLKGASR
jgi:hypothetical protein